ncbi:hypothetical protein K432DRAFT_413635 [Lepidopterella palustris CBS 459.81]|uniref:Jacalin-type lectin domain-containing protein n=1 Tax=Lepidopterella palustris CBS 459.81 TaxID=1314670 RepID=A0A8E2EJD4_9PEZI|nr:hypothetical protein K432DRAFT_413635 [Lepidopterella palustris CBS 459.81]
MSLIAPYTNAMRIGQGFNTYTQEIRLENAVTIGSKGLVSAPQQPVQGKENVDPSKPADEPPNAAALTPPTSPPNSTNTAVSTPLTGINGLKQKAVDTPPTQAAKPAPSTTNATPFGSAADIVAKTSDDKLPFDLPTGPVPKTHQSVTYSTRAIENVSDIMDALNISTSMSIKYGTIHGNGNASFVNETKVLDSELNYVVSVVVNNDAQAESQDMEFEPIPGLKLERFTEVYGDSFISGFMEGGVFNAVISVKLNDKSKLKAVKQSVDIQLAVGPPTLEAGGQESTDKEHNEAMKDTEITISVNWIGGGEIKKPTVPWTLENVVAVANAFPSMVARNSARTSAILSRYSSLRSYQVWKWKMLDEDMQKFDSDESNKGKKWVEPIIILNYVPCALYTADLFDALMIYKKLWKTIGDMLQDTSKFKLRTLPKNASAKALTNSNPQPPTLQTNVGNILLKKALTNGPMTNSPIGQSTLSPTVNQPTVPATNQSKVPPSTSEPSEASYDRSYTFSVEDGVEDWDINENNSIRDPIPPDPVQLNEARLLCREAMTLITEEASRLIDHPHLAYAQYIDKTGKTRMKRPNYAYPEVLKSRLPIPIHNDVLTDLSTDGAYLKTSSYAHDETYWFEHDMVGDAPDPQISHRYGPGAKYVDFCSLEFSEMKTGGNPLRRIALHRCSPHSVPFMTKPAVTASQGAIGAIGMAFLHDPLPPAGGEAHEDGCAHYYGAVRHSEKNNSGTWKALDVGSVDITHIDIAWEKGSGRIASMVFYDQMDGLVTERLPWRQWGSGKEPDGLVHQLNAPPDRGDGAVWRFVGLAGSFIEVPLLGQVLARVTGIWKMEGEA